MTVIKVAIININNLSNYPLCKIIADIKKVKNTIKSFKSKNKIQILQGPSRPKIIGSLAKS